MNKPTYFFYSGDTLLLRSKPVNVIAVNNNSQEARVVLEDIGKTIESLPCLFIRATGRYFDHHNNKEYTLPEGWVSVSLSGVTRWEEVNMVSSVMVEETPVVVEETLVVEETPVVVEETPVETPVVVEETPVVVEETPVEETNTPVELI